MQNQSDLQGSGCMKDKTKIIEQDEGEVWDIELDENILARNLELSIENNNRFKKHNIVAIDIMGSIGAGKTTLLEETVKRLHDKYKIFVLAGDVTTTIDVDRIAQHISPRRTIQINTGMECHLDANLIRKSLDEIDLDEVEVLFIENVGNLICPADFPLGASFRVVVASVTEGPYFVIKHPHIFGHAKVVVINKIELAGVMEVSLDQLKADVHKINPDAIVVFTNARSGDGVEEFIKALGL